MLNSTNVIRLPARDWPRIKRRVTVSLLLLCFLGSSVYAVRTIGGAIDRVGVIAEKVASIDAYNRAALEEASKAVKPAVRSMKIARGK